MTGDVAPGLFGPEYPKIQTLWKRDERNVVVPGDFSVPELEYLSRNLWVWTEKVDGTNCRLRWNGEQVVLGGRTDRAQLPGPLTTNLAPQFDPGLWRSVFADADDVTVYGEGYGPKIQSGGMYRQDQALIVFDVRVGRWWLGREDVADVARKLGLDVVPEVGVFDLIEAWDKVVGEHRESGSLGSAWPGAHIEGLVGRPEIDLFDRRGNRLLVKVKVRDVAELGRAGRRRVDAV